MSYIPDAPNALAVKFSTETYANRFHNFYYNIYQSGPFPENRYCEKPRFLIIFNLMKLEWMHSPLLLVSAAIEQCSGVSYTQQ